MAHPIDKLARDMKTSEVIFQADPFKPANDSVKVNGYHYPKHWPDLISQFGVDGAKKLLLTANK